MQCNWITACYTDLFEVEVVWWLPPEALESLSVNHRLDYLSLPHGNRMLLPKRRFYHGGCTNQLVTGLVLITLCAFFIVFWNGHKQCIVRAKWMYGHLQRNPNETCTINGTNRPLVGFIYPKQLAVYLSFRKSLWCVRLWLFLVPERVYNVQVLSFTCTRELVSFLRIAIQRFKTSAQVVRMAIK